MAEDIHRRNIERLSDFSAERTGVLVDEALLERHLRGDEGLGDLQLSMNVLSLDRAEMAALAAPRVDRLEYLLERAKGAMLLFEHHGKDDLAEAGLRDLNLVDDVLLSSGVRPHFIMMDAYRTRMMLKYPKLKKTKEDEEAIAKRMEGNMCMRDGGYRIDHLVDCFEDNHEKGLELSWYSKHSKPILI